MWNSTNFSVLGNEKKLSDLRNKKRMMKTKIVVNKRRMVDSRMTMILRDWSRIPIRSMTGFNVFSNSSTIYISVATHEPFTYVYTCIHKCVARCCVHYLHTNALEWLTILLIFDSRFCASDTFPETCYPPM